MKQRSEQGDVKAQAVLGYMYYTGKRGNPEISVTQDYSESAKWYRLAAEQGEIESQWVLAALYYQGEGIPQDYIEFARWCRIAAEQGHIEAGRRPKKKLNVI